MHAAHHNLALDKTHITTVEIIIIATKTAFNTKQLKTKLVNGCPSNYNKHKSYRYRNWLYNIAYGWIEGNYTFFVTE